MGKKMFAMLIVAVVAMFAGYNVYQSQNTVVLSELALANVEALANDSEGGGGTVYCCGAGSCKRVIDSAGNILIIAGTEFTSPCPR